MEAKIYPTCFLWKEREIKQLMLILSIPRQISLQTIVVQRFMHLSIHLQQNVASFLINFHFILEKLVTIFKHCIFVLFIKTLLVLYSYLWDVFFPALFLFFADSEFTFNILTSQKKQKFFIIVF